MHEALEADFVLAVLQDLQEAIGIVGSVPHFRRLEHGRRVCLAVEAEQAHQLRAADINDARMMDMYEDVDGIWSTECQMIILIVYDLR